MRCLQAGGGLVAVERTQVTRPQRARNTPIASEMAVCRRLEIKRKQATSGTHLVRLEGDLLLSVLAVKRDRLTGDAEPDDDRNAWQDRPAKRHQAHAANEQAFGE